MSLLRLDFTPPHRQPSAGRVVLATVLSIAGSLAADAGAGRHRDQGLPHHQGVRHFQFHDYGKLTVIGVVIACVAWPVVCRVSSAPRWLFFRLAIAVTVVLLLPDLYILHQGQPARAVAVLMLMHLAIALITYNVLVHVAPVRRPRRQAGLMLNGARWRPPGPAARRWASTDRPPRWRPPARAWSPRQ